MFSSPTSTASAPLDDAGRAHGRKPRDLRHGGRGRTGQFIAGRGLGGLMPLCPAMAMEFAPPGRAALTTGLLMTSHHADGMAATGLGLTPHRTDPRACPDGGHGPGGCGDHR